MPNNCNDCIYKLISKRTYHKNIGNITSTSLFVLPKYDIEAINDLEEIYYQATNRLFEENCNLTYAIRCDGYSPYDVSNDSIERCRRNYFNDWTEGDYIHTFLFGDARKLYYYNSKPPVKHVAFIYNDAIRYLHYYPSLRIKQFNTAQFNILMDELIQDITTLNI